MILREKILLVKDGIVYKKKLQNVRLTPDALPTIFPGLPSDLSKRVELPRCRIEGIVHEEPVAAPGAAQNCSKEHDGN